MAIRNCIPEDHSSRTLPHQRERRHGMSAMNTTHEFTLDDLADAAVRDKLKWAISEPERLRPGESRQALTERAAAAFASLAQALRERGHAPRARQPARVLHVRRGRGTAAGADVHADAGAGPPAARRVRHDGPRPVRGDVGGRPWSASSRRSASTAGCSTTMRRCRSGAPRSRPRSPPRRWKCRDAKPHLQCPACRAPVHFRRESRDGRIPVSSPLAIPLRLWPDFPRA